MSAMVESAIRMSKPRATKDGHVFVSTGFGDDQRCARCSLRRIKFSKSGRTMYWGYWNVIGDGKRRVLQTDLSEHAQGPCIGAERPPK